MLKAILIDDEPECLRTLEADLRQYCPEVEILACCNSGKAGVKSIHRLEPDVVFLDIDMPFINGFEVLEMMPNIDFEVIFTTAYDKYALQAFKISAVDYLLKPVAPEELQKAVQKAKILREKGNAAKQIQFLVEQLKDIENNTVRRVALPTQDGFEFVLLDDILYCQSDGAYTYVFLNQNKKIYISKNLRYLEDALCDFHFFRVHNSFIINLHHVQRYSRTDGGRIIMKNGAEVKVSRSKKDELMKLF